MGEALNLYVSERLTEEKIEAYWPFISEQLDLVPHIWEKWYTKDSLFSCAMMGEYDVWASGTQADVRFIIFSRIVDCPNSRILILFLGLGNDAKKCLPSLTALLERHAMIAGCTHCDVIGRQGWEKFLPGFRKEQIILSRRLEFSRVQ